MPRLAATLPGAVAPEPQNPRAFDVRTPAAAATVTLLLSACLATSPAPTPRAYDEQCRTPASPCTFSYDFEPSGVTLDPFRADPASPEFLVANEDAVLFRWTLAPKSAWDHDHVDFGGYLGQVMTKVESVASANCGGVPVLLAATNFMPSWTGSSPKRERIVAVAGSFDAPPRILAKASELVLSIAQKENAKATKVEGLALSADCRTLYVGLRSVLTTAGADSMREEIYPLTLDVDWSGPREEAVLGEPIVMRTPDTCSGRDEGISSLDLLPDGSMLVLTSFEEEVVAKKQPTDVARGRLAGSLWRRFPDGKVLRVACFPGHKPEGVVAMPDGKGARVLFEDDEYDGRPIRSFAVRVDL